MREKIEMPVNEALPMLAEMIRFTYWASTFNRASSWIYNKANSDKSLPKARKFNQKDLDMMNQSLWEIGDKLLQTKIRIEGNWNGKTFAEGETIPEQLKSLSKVVCMPYIYINKLGKNRTWFVSRTSKPDKYRFKEEDIILINLAILEIGKKLLSVEVIL